MAAEDPVVERLDDGDDGEEWEADNHRNAERSCDDAREPQNRRFLAFPSLQNRTATSDSKVKSRWPS